jgi:hypothetical protein
MDFQRRWGTIPAGIADLDNSYLAWLLSQTPSLHGRRYSTPRRNLDLANKIARDKPMSTFECTRKHYEQKI